MLLEEYFEFHTPFDIRIRGHRIGIETILDEYLNSGHTPEQIQQLYPTLRLAEIYATILYYLENQEAVSRYLTDWAEYCRQSEAEYDRNPPPVVVRLRELLKELQAFPEEERLRAVQKMVTERRAQEEAAAHSEVTEVT